MPRVIKRLQERLLSLSIGAKHASVPSASTTLCMTCAAMDFKKMLRDGLPDERMVSLGSVQDIIEKSGHCAFCRLVADLIRRRWRLDEFPDRDVRRINCSVSARGCGTLVPDLDEKGKAHRLYIHASRPPDISSVLIAAKAALHLDIQLLEEDARRVARSKDLHGRRIGTEVDPHLIKRWIKLCETAHGEACGNVQWKSGSEDLPGVVRMVDVTQMALVHADRNCRYMALSYVWGGPATDYWTSTTNAEARNHPSGLEESILPATIIDAIQLTRLIGERYLWVDALCIIQDNMEDLAAQIPIMDRLYGRAAVVIIAASGTCAKDGLPGVRMRSRFPGQHIECVQGLHLSIPLPPLREVVFDTVWSTRGWTFQEALLSSRRLYFTKHQIYFECERDVWCEDLVAESKSLQSTIHPMRFWKAVVNPIVAYDNMEMDTRAYEDAIEQYSQRHLSFDSDIMAAIMALLKAMTRALEPPGSSPMDAFRFGMWIRNLDLSLLWQPKFDSVHTRRSTPGTYWPTWAWSGWKGAAQYRIESQMLHGVDDDVHPMPAESLITAWSVVDEDGSILQLDVRQIPPSWVVDENPDEPPPEKYVPSKSNANDLVLDFLPPAGTLVFRTQRAHFQVLKLDDSALTNPSNATAHTIFHILPVDQGSRCYAGRIILPVSTPSPAIFEFIVLSRCDGVKGLWDESVWGKRYYGCMLHVMAVQRMHDDLRVRERVGVGLIVESAWMKCRTEEDVVLLA